MLGMNRKQKIVIVIMDLFLVIELTLCLYLGYALKEEITAYFLQTYVPACVVTVLLARYFVRKFADPLESAQSGELSPE